LITTAADSGTMNYVADAFIAVWMLTYAVVAGE
jgi:hypothetical protein